MDAVTLCPTLLCTLSSPAVKLQAASLLIPCKPVSDTDRLVPRPGDSHVQQAPTDSLKEAVAPPLSWCHSNPFLSQEKKKHHCIPDKGAGVSVHLQSNHHRAQHGTAVLCHHHDTHGLLSASQGHGRGQSAHLISLAAPPHVWHLHDLPLKSSSFLYIR